MLGLTGKCCPTPFWKNQTKNQGPYGKILHESYDPMPTRAIPRLNAGPVPWIARSSKLKPLSVSPRRPPGSREPDAFAYLNLPRPTRIRCRNRPGFACHLFRADEQAFHRRLPRHSSRYRSSTVIGTEREGNSRRQGSGRQGSGSNLSHKGLDSNFDLQIVIVSISRS